MWSDCALLLLLLLHVHASCEVARARMEHIWCFTAVLPRAMQPFILCFLFLLAPGIDAVKRNSDWIADLQEYRQRCEAAEAAEAPHGAVDEPSGAPEPAGHVAGVAPAEPEHPQPGVEPSGVPEDICGTQIVLLA